jgi:hypothetical protein
LLGHVKGFKEYIGKELNLDQNRQSKVDRFFESLEAHLISVSGLTTTEIKSQEIQNLLTNKSQATSLRQIIMHQERDLQDEYELLRDSYDGMQAEISKALASRYLEENHKIELRSAVSTIEEKINLIARSMGSSSNEGGDQVTSDITDNALKDFKTLHNQIRIAVRKEQIAASLFLSIALSRIIRRKMKERANSLLPIGVTGCHSPK